MNYIDCYNRMRKVAEDYTGRPASRFYVGDTSPAPVKPASQPNSTAVKPAGQAPWPLPIAVGGQAPVKNIKKPGLFDAVNHAVDSIGAEWRNRNAPPAQVNSNNVRLFEHDDD